MEGGRAKAFGPRADVLSKALKAPAPAAHGSGTTTGHAATARSLAPLRVIANPADKSGMSTHPHDDMEDRDVR
jgi:ATP-binding cassette subfamily C protein